MILLLDLDDRAPRQSSWRPALSNLKECEYPIHVANTVRYIGEYRDSPADSRPTQNTAIQCLWTAAKLEENK
jgi:hypothetical protein